MYIASIKSRSRLIHREECFYAVRIKEENRICFKTLEEARENGYRLCSDCCPISRYYRRERKGILDFCQENGISVRLNRQDGWLDVDTPYSSWKIIVNGPKNYIFLYHKNTFHIEGEKSLVPGYHSQKVLRSRILDYLYCIVDHDEYRRINPLPVFSAPKEKWWEKHYRKGTSKYRNQQKRIKRYERNRAARRVDRLLGVL